MAETVRGRGGLGAVWRHSRWRRWEEDRGGLRKGGNGVRLDENDIVMLCLVAVKHVRLLPRY